MSLLRRIEGASTGTPDVGAAPASPVSSQPVITKPSTGGLGSALATAAGGTSGNVPTGAGNLGNVATAPPRPVRQGLDSIAALRRTPTTDHDNFSELRSRVQQKLIQDI